MILVVVVIDFTEKNDKFIKNNVSYIDIPIDIRDTYQYYTKAKISKLRNIGFSEKFYSLEDGITEYVQEYLIKKKYY